MTHVSEGKADYIQALNKSKLDDKTILTGFAKNPKDTVGMSIGVIFVVIVIMV
jgi:hypothetical protein